MRKPLNCGLILMIIILAVSCDQNGFMGSRSDLYVNQPDISMYGQLLLKGEVAAVTDQIVSDNDFSTSVERVEFGDYHLVKYYAVNGVEVGTDSDLRCVAFQSIVSSFARFEYPDKWQSLDSVIEKNGEKRIELAWDKAGRYTKMRAFDGESPICVKEFAGKYELEEFLYDKNGFPRYTFTFDRDGSLSVCSENTYSELDAFGNALNIKVKTPNGSYTIRRTIEYR